MRIFLDDIRSCPDRFTPARSYEEFTRMALQNKGNIEEISLDFDLGEMHNGLDACKFLLENGILPPKIVIHSTHCHAEKMYQFLITRVPEGVKVERR